MEVTISVAVGPAERLGGGAAGALGTDDGDATGVGGATAAAVG